MSASGTPRARPAPPHWGGPPAFADDGIERSWPLVAVGTVARAVGERLSTMLRIEDVAGVRMDEVLLALDAVDAITRQLITLLPPPRAALAELGRIVSVVGAGSPTDALPEPESTAGERLQQEVLRGLRPAV